MIRFQSDECFLPAENSHMHMRMRNKIKTNCDKSSIDITKIAIKYFSARLDFFKERRLFCLTVYLWLPNL